MTERDELFRDIQNTLAGHSEVAVMQALLTSFVVAIGVSAESRSRAEEVINALPAELIPMLRENWAGYRKHRAKGDFAAMIGNDGRVKH